MFLLDTNVISELRRPHKADHNVIAWARQSPATGFFLSAISILEIELGALLMMRKDATQGAMLRAWIDDQILPRFEGRILAIDRAVAQRCVQLHVPGPRAERDALTAATALVHGPTVVTYNVADFQPAGVALLNPWQNPRSDAEGMSGPLIEAQGLFVRLGISGPAASFAPIFGGTLDV